MFEVLRGVYLTHKGIMRDISVLPAEKCLEMATIDGARVLGMDRQIGSIEKGKKADVIIVDLPNVTPLIPENIHSQIITTAMGRNVETSIIDGRVVMEKRKVLTTDPEEAMKKCKETSLDIWNRNRVNLEKRLL